MSSPEAVLQPQSFASVSVTIFACGGNAEFAAPVSYVICSEGRRRAHTKLGGMCLRSLYF